ncbi:RHS repeat-associated core domain-containing protein, partial [Pseudolactococcus yaeyamensis]
NRISKGTANEYDRKLKTDMMSWMKATDREAQLRLEESDITLSDILTKLVKMPEFLSRCLPIKDRTWRIDHEANRRKVTEEKLKKAVDTTVMIDTIEYLNDYTQTYVSPLQEQYTNYDKKVKSTYQATNFYNNNGMAIGNDLDTYHQDGLKSNITQISKENGRLYSSNLYQEFGSSERRIQDQAGYRSQYHDNSADIHLRAREYNTTTGRFLQQDTVLGSLKNPTTQNKYIYGNNNPFMYRDDAGRFGWNDVWNGIKKAAKKAVQIVDNYVVKPAVKAVQAGVNWVNKNIVQPVVNLFTGGGSSSNNGNGGWRPQPSPFGNDSLYGQFPQTAVLNGKSYNL